VAMQVTETLYSPAVFLSDNTSDDMRHMPISWYKYQARLRLAQPVPLPSRQEQEEKSEEKSNCDSPVLLPLSTSFSSSGKVVPDIEDLASDQRLMLASAKRGSKKGGPQKAIVVEQH